jgi:hypothetical protein
MLKSPLESRWYPRALAVALLSATTTGCYTTTLIPPKQASRLAVDALSLPDELRAVRNLDGEIVVLGENFTAQVEVVPGLPAGWARWSETEGVIRSPFAVESRGPKLVLARADGQSVEAPLAYVKQIRVREFSPSNTVGLALGATAAVALVAVGILLAFPEENHTQP